MMNSLTWRTPVTVAELAADYVRQALDEVTSLVADMDEHSAVRVGLICSATTAAASSRPITTERQGDPEADDDHAYTTETAQLRQRTARLRRVVHCLRQWEQCQQPQPCVSSSGGIKHEGDASLRGPGTLEPTRRGGRAHSSAVRQAVAAIEDSSRRLGVTGLKEGAAASVAIVSHDVATSRPPSPRLQPPGVPVSFHEASLSLYSRNVRVVFRRPKPSAHPSATPDKGTPGVKRTRSPESGTADGVPRHQTTVQIIAAAQKKLRWKLYTCRDALLPQIDRLASGPAVGGPPLSPALRHFNDLNKSAEAAMLCGAWRVTTKAQLLQELPRLYEDVTTILHDSLRKALLRDMPTASSAQPTTSPTALGTSPPTYFRFEAGNEGVVRVVVQEALYADITYDFTEKRWSVCRLHWNLWTTSSAATLMNAPRDTESDGGRTEDGKPHGEPPLALVVDEPDGTQRLTVPTDRPVFLDSLLTTECPRPPSEHSESPVSSAFASHSLRGLLLHHTDAMHSFLQRQFREQGFSAGCLALNRLLCTVVMDVLVRQLQTLRTDFFVGPLQSSFALDIRAGTYVAFHVLTPPVLTPTPASPLKPVHVRCDLAGGTVLVDRMWGTDTSRRRRTLLLHPSAPSQGAAPARPVVVDAEALLWSSYNL